MKLKFSIPLLVVTVVAASAGCSSDTAASVTPTEKKAFGGAPPPADYMNSVHVGEEAARKGAAKAAAEHGK